MEKTWRKNNAVSQLDKTAYPSNLNHFDFPAALTLSVFAVKKAICNCIVVIVLSLHHMYLRSDSNILLKIKKAMPGCENQVSPFFFVALLHGSTSMTVMFLYCLLEYDHGAVLFDVSN